MIFRECEKKPLHISSESAFWFYSNTLHDFFKKTDVFASFITYHSLLFFFLEKGNASVCGKRLWEFNKSLISDSEYIESMKKHICELLCLLDNQHITDDI